MGVYVGRGCGVCGIGVGAVSPGVNSFANADRFGGRVGVYCGGMPGGEMNGGAVGDSWPWCAFSNSGECVL